MGQRSAPERDSHISLPRLQTTVVQPVYDGGDAELAHRGEGFAADKPPACVQFPRRGFGRSRANDKRGRQCNDDSFHVRIIPKWPPPPQQCRFGICKSIARGCPDRFMPAAILQTGDRTRHIHRRACKAARPSEGSQAQSARSTPPVGHVCAQTRPTSVRKPRAPLRPP